MKKTRLETCFDVRGSEAHIVRGRREGEEEEDEGMAHSRNCLQGAIEEEA